MVKIYLDPGHGGRDPGAVWQGLQEKDIVLTLCMEIAKLLTDRNNVEVRMTRAQDVWVSVKNRVNPANIWGADLYLSLHCNSHHTLTPNGFESFIAPLAAHTEMQAMLHRPIAEVWTQAGRADRGQKRAAFAVLTSTRVPSILVENGFMRNAEDSRLLSDQGFITRLAAAHVAGIRAALSIRETLYTVRSGESLWTIAEAQLGRGNRWPEIMELNSLPTPMLHTGQILRMPRR